MTINDRANGPKRLSARWRRRPIRETVPRKLHAAIREEIGPALPSTQRVVHRASTKTTTTSAPPSRTRRRFVYFPCRSRCGSKTPDVPMRITRRPGICSPSLCRCSRTQRYHVRDAFGSRPLDHRAGGLLCRRCSRLAVFAPRCDDDASGTNQAAFVAALQEKEKAPTRLSRARLIRSGPWRRSRTR